MNIGSKIKELTIQGKVPSRRFIWLGILAILVLHLVLAINSPNYKGLQKRELTSGFVHHFGQHFFYYFYYQNQFPVASLVKEKDFSKEGAQKLADSNGESLIMEYKHWSRMGENARIFAYLPDAWVSGSAAKPTMKLFNTLLFVSGLISIFIGLSRIGYPLLAIILVLLFSFTPFYLFEVYHNKNIFGLLASVFLLIIGMNIRFLYYKRSKIAYLLIPIITGLIIGFFTEIRGEIKVLLLSATLLYFFASKLQFITKVGLIILLIASSIGMQKTIRHYFDIKFEKASAFVNEHGGHIYTGPRMGAHSFWHPVYCGLGDFDSKYGYKWDDIVAYRYGLDKMQKDYAIDLAYSGKYGLDEYYDQDSLYYKKLEEFDEYDQIVKAKVLHDIRNDKAWYANIILKRFERILNRTLPFSGSGWLIFPVFILLLMAKEWRFIYLLIASLPLSLTPLIIFAKGNATFNSTFPMLCLAIILMWIATYFYRQYAKPNSSNS